MEPARGAEIAVDRRRGLRGVFPLGFRRQAAAGPRREGCSFVQADGGNGCVIVEDPPAAERVLTLEILRPTERSIPASLSDNRPAVGEPQLGCRVAAGTDELAVLAVRDEPIRE